ncbi:MAG TPA: alpha/beta hydrolase [Armatimonadota bacterium]|nr:alpha/beta hydrolase [Armatimonadota bacterium]
MSQTNNRITVDGVALYYEDQGQGQPIVFLHGIGATSYSWRKIAALLSHSYRTICFDLMGFGRSDKPKNEQYTFKRQSELIIGAIRELGLIRPVLIGHSLGGGVCLSVIRELGDNQDELSGLVLIDSACYPQKLPLCVKAFRIPVIPELVIKLLPERWGVVLISRSMYKNGIEPDTAEEYARALHSRDAQAALIATGRQIFPPDLPDFIASYSRIRVPTLILWGEHDRIIPQPLGRRLASDIKTAIFHQLPNCGHCPHEEKPDAVAEAINRFLDSAC